MNEIGYRKKKQIELPGGKNLLLIAVALGIVTAVALFGPAISNLWQTVPAPTEDYAKLTGFAFVAVGPASTIPGNAHDKVVNVSANERCAVTLDATASGSKGLKFYNWVFEDGSTIPSPKTGFCLLSDFYKSGEEMRILATAVDGNGKIVEDEIKIIFR